MSLLILQEPGAYELGPANEIVETTSITAVIVNYRTPDLAQRCIDALFAQASDTIQLDAVLVDGHSEDGSQNDLQRFCERHPSGSVAFLPLPHNGGFGWANNQALLGTLARERPPGFIYFLNPDAVVRPNSLAALVARMEREPGCGAVGSLLLDEQGRQLGSAFRFPTLRSEFVRGAATSRLGEWLGIGNGMVLADCAVPCDWVTGASMLVRSAALREAGAFDDGFFLYFEDIELMWRLKKFGWAVWHEPASVVVHDGGAATGMTHRRAEGHRVRRRPTYWYRSRRRFFALTRGRAIATLATLEWIVGRAIWKLRSATIGGSHQEIEQEFADMLRHGLWVSADDAEASAPRDASAIGREPKWASHAR